MGHNNVVSSHPKSTEIPGIDGLSTGPPDLGCHSYSDHLAPFNHTLNIVHETM